MNTDTIEKILGELRYAVSDWSSSFEITYDKDSIDENRVDCTVNYKAEAYSDRDIKRSYSFTCRLNKNDRVEFEIGEDDSWWEVNKENIFAYFWFEEIYKERKI